MTDILDRAEQFVWANARLLERRQFAHLFRGAPAEPVLDALRAYQNADGGFGHALEPDKRTPSSQPIDQEFALQVMDSARFDAASASRMCDFLQTITTAEGGVPFTLPTANDAPHAPWWGIDDPRPPASINPTAGIAGLLHKAGIRHAWLDRAVEYCWRVIEMSEIEEPHSLVAALTFLQHAPDRARAERAAPRVRAQVLAHAVLDPAAAGYAHRPLDYAPEPGSLARPWFSDDLIAAHLDALQAAQQPDGGWPITWPTVSAANEVEYRGVVTLRALRTLRAYGRLA